MKTIHFISGVMINAIYKGINYENACSFWSKAKNLENAVLKQCFLNTC